jgi:hypothetical protein
MGHQKILIDNDSQVKILFLATFNTMDFDRKQLKEPSKPLYGFSGKRIKPVRTITLAISFGTPTNPCIEYITFDVVDMPYPCNAIFGRGLLNTFKFALPLHTSVSKYQRRSMSYPYLAASKKSETSRRTSR